MASLADLQGPGKMSFPGPLGSKRRRMRSGGNVSTLTNNQPKQETQGENVSEQKTAQTSKCKGSTTIPIFLKKTYKMVDTCDPNIASWTEDGEMFVVKDPDTFATQIIPQYFDHNKFSSFARQLNFYGFRKMQSKPIRNSDYDAGTAKHVTFYNENFKRGRCDLLKKIQRSTRGGGGNTNQDQSREISALRDQVKELEQKVADMETQHEDRIRRLELDMLGRMEQMMLAVQQQQRTQLQLEKATSVGTVNTSSASSAHSAPVLHQQQQQQMPAVGNWDLSQFNYPRGASISSAVNSVANAMVGNAQQQQFQQPIAKMDSAAAAPTLPPHPKQKLTPMGSIPGAMGAPADRMNSLRGISTMTRGASGLARGASIESSASAVLMRNSWEDKFFSMLMLDDAANGGGNNSNNPTDPADLSPTPIPEAPVTVSESSTRVFPNSKGDDSNKNLPQLPEQDDEFSDVSNPDL